MLAALVGGERDPAGAGRAGPWPVACQAAPAAPSAAGPLRGPSRAAGAPGLVHLEQLEASIADSTPRSTGCSRCSLPLGIGWTPSPGVASGRPSAWLPTCGWTSRCSHRRPAGVMGGPRPGHQPHRRQAPLGRADQGQPLAGGGADRVRLGRRPQPRHLPGRPAAGGWPAASASRRPRSRWGTRSWSRLASAHRRLRRPGPRRRLLHPARHRAPASTGRRQLQTLGYQVTLQPAA